MAERRVNTMKLSGNDYAKVAERLKLFRADRPNGKSETAHTYMEDGSVEFKAWLWKDKKEFMDLVKSGVTDKDVLRSTADADGDAKGPVGVKQKDFEKLQTIAMGRALANLGYLGSGDVASFEEMEAYENSKEIEKQNKIRATIEKLEYAKDIDELRTIFGATEFKAYKEVIDAKDKRKLELTTAPFKQGAVKTSGDPEKTNEVEPIEEAAEEDQTDASN